MNMKTTLFIAFLCISMYAHPQWQTVTNEIPSGEEPYYLVSFDSVIFCTTYHLSYPYFSLFWSFNNGDNWTLRSGNGFVSSYKNRLYGGSADTVFVSTDSGMTRQSLIVENHSLKETFSTKLYSSDRNAGWLIQYFDTIILGGVQKYYKSSDDGWTWYKYPIASYNSDVRVLANDTNIFFRINEPDKGCIKYYNNSGQLVNLYRNADWSNNYIMDAMFLDSLLFICCDQLLVLHNGVAEVALSGCGFYCAKSIVSYGDTVFVAFNNTVYKAHKSDYLNWESDGLSVTGSYNYIKALYIYNNYLFALSTYDVYRRELAPLSVSEKQKEPGIKLFPNPATDILNTNIPANSLPAGIKIYDIYGRTVMDFNVNTADESIDISGLPKGVYIVKIKSQTEARSFKVLKE